MSVIMPVSNFGAANKDEPYLGYRKGKLIGQGSYGEVWEAVSPAGKPVALKFMRGDNERGVTRELRALQSIGQLKHPNLIKTFQIWADGSHVVVAMELAECSLLDLLHISFEHTGQPFSVEFACYYLKQAARALDFLNTRQHLLNGQRVAVRHCDVKPSNMLVFSNVVKVADFGFSVLTTSSMWDHEKVGTLNFAAQEVFQGRLCEHTDQFSLGVTYYLLRTGQYPFPKPPPTFERGYVRPAPDLSLLNASEIPILRRALHPIPQNRWPSCTEMIDSLQKATK